MASPWKKLESVVETAGCTYQDCDGCVYVDAPVGKVFAASGTHTIVGYYDDGWGGTGAEKVKELWAMVRDVEDRINYGVDDCEDEECEVCEREEEN